MSSLSYDAYAYSGGETDLQEIMQFCSDLSSNNSVSPTSCSPPDPEMQPMIIDDDFFDVAGLQFDDDLLAFDFGEQNSHPLLSQSGMGAQDNTVELHAQRSKQVQELGICLDISSALATPLKNHSSYPMLEPQLREELVVLYFDHVHPACPVIDEQNFWWHFMALNEDEFHEMFPAMMFNAMMFAAFGHATDEQVRRAGFSSVDEVQSKYFHVLSDIYNDAQPQVLCDMGELVLAKTSLLLSLWCPPKLEITASSLWADRAMSHTKRYLRKTSPARPWNMPKRRDILVWCCITRNTFISYSMRRPYRLCMEEEPICDPEDVRSEFDREVQFHNFCSPAAKVRMVEDFVTMCKLSQNFRNILYLQRCMMISIQNQDLESAQDGYDVELHNCLSRYLKTAEAEAELEDLIELHEVGKCEGADMAGGERPSEVVAARTRSYLLQIMAFSGIVSLYQFTISADCSTWDRSCYRTALSKLFDASKKVACIVEHMLSDVPIEAIPGTIVAWTTAPMIPLLVDQNCSKFGLPGLSHDIDDSDSDSGDVELTSSSHARQIASLLELTNRMAPRFHSARDAQALLQDADHILCLNAASVDSEPGAVESVVGDLAVEKGGGSWGLLVKAMKFVDSEMASGGSISVK